MNRSLYFVYRHRRASDGLPFYVGKGRKYRERDFTNRSDWWKRVARKHGVIIEFLHINLSEEESKLLEVMEINNHKAVGYPMVNKSLGGDGNHGWVPSDETKKRIGDANRGKSPSEDTRKKMSISHTGRRHDEKTKIKIGEANRRRSDQFNKLIGTKRRSKEPHIFMSLDLGFFEILTQSEMIEKYGLNSSKVSDILAGRRSHHKGWVHLDSCNCSKLST